MGNGDEQKLRELFHAARQAERQDVPPFDDVLSAAKRSRETVPARSRLPGFAPRFALAAMAIIAALVLFGKVLTGPYQGREDALTGAQELAVSEALLEEELEEHNRSATVHHNESFEDSPLLDIDTENLLFAMSDGEAFTDFLLLNEDAFFSYE